MSCQFDYGARMYNPEIGRWFNVDPLAEKYYPISPYAYVANNPMKYVDFHGDSISVAQEYREQFMKDMKNVFGDNASSFLFNSTGKLTFNGDTKNLTDDQQKVFEGLNGVMSDVTTTNIAYGEEYTGGSTTYKTSEFGGALTAKGVKMNGGEQNLILISPSISSVSVSLDTPLEILRNGQANVLQNTTTGLFHEIGEVITTNLEYRGTVIDYENHVRNIIGLPTRPYDLNHSKTVKTIYKK